VKRVLIITYYWPPSGGPGVQRVLYFVKYLRQFGWEPVVFTVEDGEYPILDSSLEKEIPEGIETIKRKIWEPYKLYKVLQGRKKHDRLSPALIKSKSDQGFKQKLSVWIRGNFFIPDARKYWIKPSIKYLTRYLTDHPVDAIISSSPPQSGHLIALGIHQILNIPWLADFRDPWTGISYFGDLQLSKFAENKHRSLEKEVLQSATEVVTIGNVLAQYFEEIGERSVKVVRNGFDHHQTLPEVDRQTETIDIVYAGSLTGNRNPVNFWKLIKQLSSETENNIRVKMIGNIDPFIMKYTEDLGLKDIVSFSGYIPHAEVFKLYASADILLMISIPNEPFVLTGKLYEYLFAQKPILSIGTKGDEIESILKLTNAGLNADFSDYDTLKSNLITIIKSIKENKTDEFVTDSNVLKQFSREHITGQLAYLLETMVTEKER
jgi:glycosyltransferase involved in cell wall biosynthesis